MSDQSALNRSASRPGNGRFVGALFLGIMLGLGAALLWENNIPAKQPTDQTANSSPAIKDLQDAELNVANRLQALQQTVESGQAELKQTLASEQAETKSISDQFARLSSKFEALQQSFASAQQPPSSEPAKKRR